MRKIREVLRLHSLGLKQRQIARACAIGQSTVSDYIKQAEAAGLTWAEVADWDEDRLLAKLEPVATPALPKDLGRLPQPDYADVHAELQKHKHLTLQLVWEEYRTRHPEGYRYSRFCELYQRWRKKQEVALRQEHRPGEKLFVDYAGATIAIQDPATGEVRHAQLFVAVLGASNYTFADVTWTQNLPDWIGSHVRAFEFFEGVPEIVVPDNLKSGVTRSCRYEPGVNITYEEMAGHYGIAVVPARPYKPRDKAKVEVGVQIAERWILAALRKQTFFSLGEASRAVAPLLTRLNERTFRKREGSRKSLFDQLDRPALRPLPVERFQYGDWKTARVNIDYHVEFDQHWYSVSYELTQQQVEIRATDNAVEIFHKGVRVASHGRSHIQHKHTTLPEHRPKAHQRHKWSTESWRRIGIRNRDIVPASASFGWAGSTAHSEWKRLPCALCCSMHAATEVSARCSRKDSTGRILRSRKHPQRRRSRFTMTMSAAPDTMERSNSPDRRPSCSISQQQTSSSRCDCAAWRKLCANNRRAPTHSGSASKNGSEC
jgi:transposase